MDKMYGSPRTGNMAILAPLRLHVKRARAVAITGAGDADHKL